MLYPFYFQLHANYRNPTPAFSPAMRFVLRCVFKSQRQKITSEISRSSYTKETDQPTRCPPYPLPLCPLVLTPLPPTNQQILYRSLTHNVLNTLLSVLRKFDTIIL